MTVSSTAHSNTCQSQCVGAEGAALPQVHQLEKRWCPWSPCLGAVAVAFGKGAVLVWPWAAEWDIYPVTQRYLSGKAEYEVIFLMNVPSHSDIMLSELVCQILTDLPSCPSPTLMF